MCRSHSNPASNLPQLVPGLGDREWARIFFSSFPKTGWKKSSASLCAGLFDEHKHLKSLLLANAWHLRLFYKWWWIFAGCPPRSHPLGQHKLRVFYWKISIANRFSPSSFSSPLVSGWLVLCSDKLRVWNLLLCKRRKKKNVTSGPVCNLYMKCPVIYVQTPQKVKFFVFVFLYLRMQTSSHVHLQKHRSKNSYTHPWTCTDMGLHGQCSVCFQAPMSICTKPEL